MTTAPGPRVAVLRGASVGLLTVSLAAGAHGAAGGGVPGAHSLAAVAALGALVGSCVALAPGLRRGTPALLLVLAASQYAAHRTLCALMGADHPLPATGHAAMSPAATGSAAMNPGAMSPGAMSPGAMDPSATGHAVAGPGADALHEGPTMLLAHLVAVVACVVLVRGAERALALAGPVLRRVLPVLALLVDPPRPRPRATPRTPDPAPRVAGPLLLVTAAPRRGPPAGLLAPC